MNKTRTMFIIHSVIVVFLIVIDIIGIIIGSYKLGIFYVMDVVSGIIYLLCYRFVYFEKDFAKESREEQKGVER